MARRLGSRRRACGISAFMLRDVVCWMMIVLTPAALVAADADSGAAVLYGRGKGTVLLNGRPLPGSSAVFPGDLIQTQQESLATLDAPGSGVIVLQDSLVRFERNAVSLQHGGVNVATSHGMVALAKQVTVTPVSNTWTEFEVVETSDTVQVMAGKGDVNVNCGKDSTTLSPGDQATGDDSGNCHKKKRKAAGAPLPTDGSVLTNPYVVAGVVIGGGGVVCLLLCSSSKPNVSQSKP
jgi:hypothetical protein